MSEAVGQFVSAIEAGDASRAREVWRTNPQLMREDADGTFVSYYIRRVFPRDDVEMLQTLVDLGADINYLPGKTARGFALEALWENALSCFEFLLKNGVQINFDTSDGVRCFALEEASRKGLLAATKMLVEHGAVFDYRWNENSPMQGNPLSLAMKYGHDEVADYLRSIGCPEPKQENGAASTESDALQGHLATHFGNPDSNEFQQNVSGEVPISVAVSRSDDELVLVTRGMSAEPVTQNDGTQLYAELIMQLPADWELSLESDDDTATWPIICLQQLAAFPHQTGQPFSFYVMCPNGSPPEPILNGYPFTGVMAIQAAGDFATYTDGDKDVQLYHVLPMYTEEFELVEKAGLDELLTRFQAAGVGQRVDLSRPNVAAD
ncbi:MAG: suppressor of fused domain protein [Planctomycetota bacterium]